MLGAIAGDIIGSIYEHRPIKTKEFPFFAAGCRFTDDTVLTVAVADAILSGREYAEALHDFGHRYPRAGYGGSFLEWLHARERAPYGSWGNGSAMRVSPVGWAFDSEDDVLEHARLSAEVTHDHPEGIKGAQALALAVFLARTGCSRADMRRRIGDLFGYDLGLSVDEIRADYAFDVSCQGSVPQAIVCFLDSDSWEDAVRNAVSLGGDSDTLACMAGAVAEAYYGEVPAHLADKALRFLPHDLGIVVEDFRQIFMDDL
ncbi:ADP-ribosylglycohydrolase family protein [Desulfomicrobium salsuginis]